MDVLIFYFIHNQGGPRNEPRTHEKLQCFAISAKLFSTKSGKNVSLTNLDQRFPNSHVFVGKSSHAFFFNFFGDPRHWQQTQIWKKTLQKFPRKRGNGGARARIFFFQKTFFRSWSCWTFFWDPDTYLLKKFFVWKKETTK